MLSNQQFERTQRLALKLAGIELVERHRELVARRCRRQGIHDSAGLEALLAAAETGDAAAAQRLLCLLTTKFTGFFRHAEQFRLAAEHARAAAADRGAARLWSAAAATGEEPYSLAMALIERCGHDDPPVQIVATDVDAAALATAARGEYAETALAGLNAERRARFLRPGGEPRRFAVAEPVRRLVEFRTANLAGAEWPVRGPLDVVFCRNVLMYLEVGRRTAVLGRIADLLAPDGLLLLDPVENLGGAADLFAPRAEGVFARRAAAGERRGAGRSGGTRTSVGMTS